MPQVPITVSHAPERRRPSRRPRASRLSTEPLRQPAGHAGCPGPFHQVRDGRSYRQWEAQARSPRSGPTGGYSLGAFFRMYLGTNTANGPMVGWHDVRAPHCRTPPQGHSCHVLPTSIFLAESHQARLRGMPGPPKCRAPRRETCTTVAAQARTVHDLLFPLLPARQPLPPRCGRRCCPRRPQGCP